MGQDFTDEDISDLADATARGGVQWYLLPVGGKAVPPDAMSDDPETAALSNAWAVHLEASVDDWKFRVEREVVGDRANGATAWRFQTTLAGYSDIVYRERRNEGNGRLFLSAAGGGPARDRTMGRLFAAAAAGARPWRDTLLPTRDGCLLKLRCALRSMASPGHGPADLAFETPAASPAARFPGASMR